LTEKINLLAIRHKILKTENDLFDLKLQYKQLYKSPAGKIIIDPPNNHRCATCFNTTCVFHPSYKKPPRFVKYVWGVMATQGCLSWLPKDLRENTG